MAGETTITQQAELMARLQQLVTAAVRRAWRAVPDLSDQSAEQWVGLVVPLVAGAQQRASTLTVVALADMMADVTGEAIPASAIDPVVVSGAVTRGGADPSEVYRRPIVQARSLLAQGVAGADALRRSEIRAVQMAATDVQLARTHTSRQVFASDERIVGYRRVLTGAESCGLCVVASTQRYRREELMPIHPGCDCGVAPMVGTEDPGRVINRPLLDSLHHTIGERYGQQAATLSADSPEYRALVTTYDHGEYGPTLAVTGHQQMDAGEALARN